MDQRFRQFMAEVEQRLPKQREVCITGNSLDASHHLINEAEDAHDLNRCGCDEEVRDSAITAAARAFLLAEACGYAKPTPTPPKGDSDGR